MIWIDGQACTIEDGFAWPIEDLADRRAVICLSCGDYVHPAFTQAHRTGSVRCERRALDVQPLWELTA